MARPKIKDVVGEMVSHFIMIVSSSAGFLPRCMQRTRSSDEHSVRLPVSPSVC